MPPGNEKFNYDSYCGTYCGACDIMLAGKTGCVTGLSAFWKESTVKAFQAGLGLEYDDTKPFELKCRGCKSAEVFTNCEACKIRACAIEKGVEHCIDCGEYPCGLHAEMKKACFFLPHIRKNRANMRAISRNGLGPWLTGQRSRWRCPRCSTEFSWYSTYCRNCGRDLSAYTFTFSFVRSSMLKAGIYFSSYINRKQR